MESDSTLPALTLAVSILILAIAEAGAAAIAARLQSAAYQLTNGDSEKLGSLDLITQLPGGPIAPLKLIGMVAFGGALTAVVSISLSAWNAGLGLLTLATISTLIGLGVVILLARYWGARYSDPLCQFMPRVAWMLSFPLRPALLVHDALLNGKESEAEPSLNFALSVDSNSGPLDEHEVRMIKGVVQLDQTVAREIMVPRVDIAAVEADTTLDALAEAMNTAGHSRVPVYKTDLDHIEGVAHAKDVLRQIARGLDPAVATARDVSRPPLFVPESKTLEELLGNFQEQRVHLAVVVDEYGGVSGIVTIEDLLEEIVGEIQDEFDSEEPVIRSVGKSEFLVDARLPIDELNESLGINIAADGFDTIGGLVFDQLGKVPVQGDRVHHDGLSIVVVDTVGRRPNMLRVTARNRTAQSTPRRIRDVSEPTVIP